MKRYEVDLNNPNPLERVRVNKDGRRYNVYLKPGEHPILGLKPRYPHPAYARGYAKAVSHEYQTIVIPLFNPHVYNLPEDALDLAAGLNIPRANYVTHSYEEMVSYYEAVANGVKVVRPDLASQLDHFICRHGLDAIPWGRGWVYSSIPQWRTYSSVGISMDLPEGPVGSDFKPLDRRTTPALDALTLYLHLTKCWRNEEVREILESLICFECNSNKKAKCECDLDGLANCECDLKNSANCPRPVCFGSGGGLSVRLTSRINFIKTALNTHRGQRGRPSKPSRCDVEEVRFVLSHHLNYGVLRREIRRHHPIN